MRLHLVILALVLSATALVSTACGGSSSSSEVARIDEGTTAAATSPQRTTAAPEDPRDAILAFTRCMRENGIDIPDPDFSNGAGPRFQVPRDVDSPKFRAAMQKCREHLESIRQRFDPELREKFQDAVLAFAKCMREHGVDVPDPDFSQGPGAGRIFRDIDPNDPKVREAMDACRKVFTDAGLPGPGGGLPGRGRP
jgi:hypothetical protein